MADPAPLVSWYESAKGEVPLPLTGPSLTLSPLPAPHPPTVFMFGGKVVPTRRISAETWAMDLTTRTWSRVNAGTGPGPRYFHSMDIWEDKLVCFGGMSEGEKPVQDDIWFFDCRSRRWMPQPAPAPGLAQDPDLVPQARYAHLTGISRGQLFVVGGQRGDNTWIYEINTYDLDKNLWVSKTDQPESHGLHSKGAYRSVAFTSPNKVVVPVADSSTMGAMQLLPYSTDEEGGGGDLFTYSNYDFAKVRRELEALRPLDGAPEQQTTSDKFTSPPGYMVADLSTKMTGQTMPPGLRFPDGGVVGHHFILCGLYLASTSAAFSIWALDLTTLQWRHIEPAVLQHGSWNRAVLCPDTGRMLVFGNAQSDLATDYGKRAVNLDHIAVVELETYGIYCPPKLVLSDTTVDTGLRMLDEKLVSDFEIVAEDGRRVRCSRKILSERWPWFAEQQAALVSRASDAVAELPAAVDINDVIMGSLSPARMTPNRLHLPEQLPVCVALIQYFYTLSLPTPLQSRSPILSALLFLAKQYKIERLRRLVVHALHHRLQPQTAVGIYEVATLAGEHNLQARALQMVHQGSKAATRVTQSRRPGSAMANDQAGPSSSPTVSTHGQVPDAAAPPSQQPGYQDESQYRRANGAQDASDASEKPSLLSVPRRRPRPDSCIMPTEEMVAHPQPKLTLEAETSFDNLLAAMDLPSVDLLPPSPTSARSPSPRSPTSPHFLRKPHGFMSRNSSPSSMRRGASRASKLPPMLPPPDRPLPIRPAQEMLLTPNTPLTDDTLRASSPTISEATSGYPRTPCESTRDGTILSREQSPITPSPLSERRPSFSDSLSKSKLPSVAEDYSCETDSSRFSESSSLLVSREARSPTSAPSPTRGSLGMQQDDAMRTLTAGSKLTRAVSLSSLALGTRRARASLPVFVDGERKASSILGDAAEISPPPAYSPRVGSAPPLDDKKKVDDSERLEKFHAFITEQQRQAGSSYNEAIGRARRATRGSAKARLSRLGAKFADAILHA